MALVVFVAPFPLETTMRFARAAAELPGVNLCGVMQEAPKGEDRRVFTDVAPVADALSTTQIIAAIQAAFPRSSSQSRMPANAWPIRSMTEGRAAISV